MGMRKRGTHQRSSLNESISKFAIGRYCGHSEFTRIHVIPVPEYLVRIEPRRPGLEYFVFRDEVVIANPRDLRVVAIVPV